MADKSFKIFSFDNIPVINRYSSKAEKSGLVTFVQRTDASFIKFIIPTDQLERYQPLLNAMTREQGHDPKEPETLIEEGVLKLLGAEFNQAPLKAFKRATNPTAQVDEPDAADKKKPSGLPLKKDELDPLRISINNIKDEGTKATLTGILNKAEKGEITVKAAYKDAEPILKTSFAHLAVLGNAWLQSTKPADPTPPPTIPPSASRTAIVTKSGNVLEANASVGLDKSGNPFTSVGVKGFLGADPRSFNPPAANVHQESWLPPIKPADFTKGAKPYDVNTEIDPAGEARKIVQSLGGLASVGSQLGSNPKPLLGISTGVKQSEQEPAK